uniref:Uncharacterized protein n=1 Tax=Panagrolaimus sp. JU765 TaxID=591449 RepID=A0AC34RSH3_9BILA
MVFSAFKRQTRIIMGSSYSALSTNDDTEMLALAVKDQPQKNGKMPRSFTMFDKLPNCRTPVHVDTINCLGAVRPGMVLSGSSDKTIVLNNVDTGECVVRWRGHTDSVTKVAYKQSQSKHYVLSGSRDSTVKLWMFNRSDPLEDYTSHKLTVTAVCNIEDNMFVTGGRDTNVMLFDINRKQPVVVRSINRNLVTHITKVPSTSMIAQTSEDRIMKLYDSRDLAPIFEFPIKNHIQHHCSASNDGNYVLASSGGTNGDGCEITLYDMRQQKEMKTFRGHEESVKCAVFLSQTITCKRIILSVSDDKTIRLWSMEDNKCLWREPSPTHSELTSCIGFTDGNIVVAGSNASLCHLRMNGKAGVPFLQCLSVQSKNTLTSSISSSNFMK